MSFRSFLRSIASASLAALAVLSAAPGARADDTPQNPATPPVEKNPIEAKKELDAGDALREQSKWDDAAHAYGRSLDHDEDGYFCHVRYQETVIRSGHGAELPAEYDGLVKKHAGDVAMRLHRMRLDEPKGRVAALTALQKESPGPMVALELGRALLASGDAAGAKKALEPVLTARPDLADVFELSCEALRLSGDAAGARARLEAKVRQSPEAYEAHLRIARMDLADDKAKEALERAVTVLAMRPSYLAAHLVKSEASSRLGATEDARSAIDAALRINPADPDALVASADLMAKGAKDDVLKQALVAYKKVLDLKEGPRLHALVGAGWVYERLGQLKEASEAYGEASRIAPNDASVVNSAGVVMLKQKSFNAALVLFKKATDLDPKSPEAYCNIATVAEQQSDWPGAIVQYEKVLSMKGQEANIRALLNCAFDHDSLTQYKKAEELYSRARQARPNDSDIATFLGDNLWMQKKYKPSVKAYQDAVKLDEKNLYAWRGLGSALWSDDKPQDAVEALLKARALKATDPTTLFLLGEIYRLDLEDPTKALEAYEAYVKAGGTNPDVPTYIENLKDALKNGGK